MQDTGEFTADLVKSPTEFRETEGKHNENRSGILLITVLI
jgi:hypothetical protein